MGFTQGTIDFLFENRLHDSREWFGEHKQDYRELVVEPLGELVTELAPVMAKIDKLIICDPKNIPRCKICEGFGFPRRGVVYLCEGASQRMGGTPRVLFLGGDGRNRLRLRLLLRGRQRKGGSPQNDNRG